MAFNFDTFGTKEQDSAAGGVFNNPTGDESFSFDSFGGESTAPTVTDTDTEEENPVVRTFREGGERVVREAQKIKPATDIFSLAQGTLQTTKTIGTGALETLKGAGSIVAEPFRLAFNLIPEKTRQKLGASAEEALENAFVALPDSSKKKIQNTIKFLEENPNAKEVAQDTADLLLNTVALQAGASKRVASAAIRASKKVGTGGQALKTASELSIAGQRRDFVRDLIRPDQTKKIKESQVRRTQEKGFGLFKKSEIQPTKTELAAEAEVLKIPGVRKNNTVQGNFNVIQAENTLEAQNLVKALEKNDFAFPKKELVSRLNKAKEELARNPVITGDAEKTAQKLIAEFERRLAESKGKGSSLLQVRKDFDTWVQSQKGANVFDPAKENAFSVSNRAIRNTVNDFLEEKATNVAVKESLRKQSSLFRAMDNLTPKAAKEADTAIGRIGQRATNILGTKNKVVQGVAAAVGIGGLGAAATFAPAAAAAGLGGYLVVQSGRLVLGPQTRKAVGALLEELLLKRAEAVGAGATAGATAFTLKEIDGLISELEEFIEDYSTSEEE